jgi:hypothetical protein
VPRASLSGILHCFVAVFYENEKRFERCSLRPFVVFFAASRRALRSFRNTGKISADPTELLLISMAPALRDRIIVPMESDATINQRFLPFPGIPATADGSCVVERRLNISTVARPKTLQTYAITKKSGLNIRQRRRPVACLTSVPNSEASSCSWRARISVGWECAPGSCCRASR